MHTTTDLGIYGAVLGVFGVVFVILWERWSWSSRQCY